MMGIKPAGLASSTISATISEGFTVTTADGKPARLAVIDEDGNVIEASPAVAAEAWAVCIQVQYNFWVGEGHIRVLSKPDAPCKPKKAA